MILSPLPGGLLPAVGALAFGPWMALALTLGGVAAGSMVVFALARRWGKPLVRRLLKPQTIERYTGVLAARGGLWLFVIVAIPVLPGDAVCALAGLSSISFRRFIAASTLKHLVERAPSHNTDEPPNADTVGPLMELAIQTTAPARSFGRREAFLALATHRFRGNGLYLLDEPEAALSPARQLALLPLLDEHVRRRDSRFVIATHSPVLLAYPTARIYQLTAASIVPVAYEDTEYFRITHDFLTNRDSYLRHLLTDADERWRQGD